MQLIPGKTMMVINEGGNQFHALCRDFQGTLLGGQAISGHASFCTGWNEKGEAFESTVRVNQIVDVYTKN